MTTRPTPERLAEIRSSLANCGDLREPFASARDLLAEVDALVAELAAATTRQACAEAALVQATVQLAKDAPVAAAARAAIKTGDRLNVPATEIVARIRAAVRGER